MLRNAVKVWQDVKEFCSLVNGTIKSDVMYVKKRGGRVFLHPGRITEEQHFVNIDSVWSKKRDNIYSIKHILDTRESSRGVHYLERQDILSSFFYLISVHNGITAKYDVDYLELLMYIF